MPLLFLYGNRACPRFVYTFARAYPATSLQASFGFHITHNQDIILHHIQCRHSRTKMTSAKDVCHTVTVYARAQRRACTVACGHRGSIRRMQYRQRRDHRGAFYTASCRMPSTSTDSPGMPSLRSCMPGYGMADILADVIFPIATTL